MESNVAQIPLSHKAWGWFEKNQKQAVAGVAGALVLGVIVAFFIWNQGRKQTDASSALSNVLVAQNSGSGTTPAATPQAYLNVVNQYPNTKAAERALLLAAGALFTEGKYSEAQAQFERFVKDYHNSPLRGQALLGVASCLEAQGKIDQAVSAYKDLITRHPTDSVVPQAKFSLGGLYEQQKRPELARDMYEQVERESRFSILGSEAGMRLEEIAQKNPNLKQSASIPTPLPMTGPIASAGSNPPVGSNLPAGSNPPVQVLKK